MTREHAHAKRQAARLQARLRSAGRESPQVVVSHDDGCGSHTHRRCSCEPLICAFAADGEAYLVGEDGRMHRLERL